MSMPTLRILRRFPEHAQRLVACLLCARVPIVLMTWICVLACPLLTLAMVLLAAPRVQRVQMAARMSVPVHDPRAAGQQLLSLVGSATLAEVASVLAAGADPDARDGDGRTALHLAVEAGRWQMLTVLLLAGANPDAVDHRGQGPLHVAVAWGRPGFAQQLLLRGRCDVDLRDREGRTPLMLAVLADRDDLVDLLLAAGANPRLRDAQERTAVELALAAGNLRMAQRRLLQ